MTRQKCIIKSNCCLYLQFPMAITCSAHNYTLMPKVNATNMSAEETLAMNVRYYTTEVGIPIMSMVGMVGNVLNFIVLTREKLRHSLTKMEKSAHIGLIGLAFSDFMFCFLVFLYTQIEFQKEYKDLGPLIYFDWLIGPAITWFIVTSTWLTVAMAAERYLAVCHPFKARKLSSLKKTRIIITMVYVICLGCLIPLGFERIIQQTCYHGEMMYKITPRPSYTQKAIVIRRLVWAILFDFVPCIALLYFNVCLIFKIHRAKRIRRQMTNSQNQDVLLTKYPRELFSYNSNTGSSQSQSHRQYSKPCNGKHQMTVYRQYPTKNDKNSLEYSCTNMTWRGGNQQTAANTNNATPTPVKKQMRARRRHTDSALNSVTATLVAVIVLFLILVSPSEILKFSYTLSGGEDTPTYAIIKNITNLMQTINFSMNFVLYCFVNKSFRTSLKDICFWLCRKHHMKFRLRGLERTYCNRIEFSESES